jgi:putative Holliday junction resolvase
MGIDFGEKRVGIAVSSDDAKMAFPHSVLENNRELIEKIEEICQEKGVRKIVIGESKNFEGEDNPLMKKIIKFKEKLEKKLELDIIMEPEFMTSVEAKRIQGENEMHDASAAALILKSYIDKKNGND